MSVTVRLMATLGRYLPEGARARQTEVNLEGGTVGEALARLGVPRESANVILVNGTNRDWESRVEDGDSITVFPAVVGGCLGPGL